MPKSPVATFILLLGLAGCARDVGVRGVVNAPQMQPSDPIKTLADYQKAVTAAENALPRELVSAKGKAAVELSLAALARLPSAESRRYAQSLANLARKGGMQLPQTLPGAATAPAMTYAELAQVEVLSHQLLLGLDDQEMPLALRQGLFDAVFEGCPSDAILLRSVNRPMARKFVGFYDLAFRRDEVMPQIDKAFQRLIDPKRPLTLPALTLLARWSNDNELALMMLSYGTALSQSNGHALRDLAEKLRAAGKRALEVDRSPETRKMVAALNEKLDDAFIDQFDAKIKLAQDGAPAIKEFLRALKDKNQKGLATVADAAVIAAADDLRAPVTALLQPDMNYVVVGDGFSSDTDAVRLFARSAANDEGPVIDLALKLRRDGTRIIISQCTLIR